MLEINLPHIVEEVECAFHYYEDALMNNRVEVLNELFWNSNHTIRYGRTENLHGHEAIAVFRARRVPTGLTRTLRNTVITSYGQDFATTNTEFQCADGLGRQSQTWVRMPEGWRIVAAHVSLLKAPAAS